MYLNQYVLGALLLLPTLSYSQQKTDTTTAEPKHLGEVIVYANKFAESANRVAQTVKSIRDKTTLNMQANTGDILINTGTLFVQKSQQGGGSPVIRGFEASRVVLTVDGVRLNNAIYRAGHLQNVITIDNMILDRMEVLYGPSSTLYGSDALGGVVSLFTKNPILSPTGKTNISGSSTLRYATAIDEKRANVILNIGGAQWASLTSVTYGSFGDLRQGRNRKTAYPDFGKKNFIVQRAGNSDIALPNPDPDKQTPSCYNQIDVTQKFLYRPNQKIQHILNLQFSNTNDIPRYDRLSETAGAQPVYAEWYYGPQLRNMVSYHFSAYQQPGFFQSIQLTASYQDLEESRVSRRFQNNNKDYRWERVNIFGVNIDAKHYHQKNELHVGAESYFNFVQSTAERRNIVSQQLSRISTRYSDGPTRMTYHALYAQHTYKKKARWTVNDGLRLNLVQLDARFADTSLLHFPFTRATQKNIALTGNLGLIYADTSDFRIAGILSSGFRAPNVDDLSKVFDSRTGIVVVPNTQLKPEYTYNAEINFNKYGRGYSVGGSLFYTWFRNALVLDKFQFNGQDSILYSGVKSAVFANQNKASASISGFSVNAAVNVLATTVLDGVFTYTKGRFTGNNNQTVPLDHIPPVYGRIGIKHSQPKWNAEAYVMFNGWKRLSAYNPNGEDNLQYATPDGTPAWTTWNLRASAQLARHIQLQVLVENLTDRNYRYFASGISAPGRNLSISLKTNF